MSLMLAPSILSADFTRLGADVIACEQSGADWIHVDVMDGHFVPNMTIGPLVVEACRRAVNLPLDVHLMIEKPERYLEAFAKAGASRLTVHVETCPHIHRTMQQIRDLGIKPGVAINPGTPALLIKEILPMVDLVLVMTVNPGFGAQAFLPEMLTKITEIRKMLDTIGSPTWLEVDGGISDKSISILIKAGATAFVAGNSVFKHPNGIGSGVKSLKSLINQN